MSARAAVIAALDAAREAAALLPTEDPSSGGWQGIVAAARTMNRVHHRKEEYFYFDHFYNRDDFDQLAAELAVAPSEIRSLGNGIVTFHVHRGGMSLSAQASAREVQEPAVDPPIKPPRPVDAEAPNPDPTAEIPF